MSTAAPVYTLGQISALLELSCQGDADTEISGLATLASATKGQLSFLANAHYQTDLLSTSASAVIVTPAMAELCPSNVLLSANPYLSYAQASALFSLAPKSAQGIHSSAVVSASADISPSASVAANVVIGDGVTIDENSHIGPGTVIGDGVHIGANCLLHANVSIYQGVTIGARVILHSGVVLGSDGFGYAPGSGSPRWHKIHQLGAVRIGNDVEIGANTVVDRGALDDTVIGNGVIIDNLVQIAHNVVIGDNTAIAGCTAIAGSSKIGSGCTIAGRASILGHLSIADGCHITTNSLVSKSIDKPGSYSSGTAGVEPTKAWRKNAVRFSKLNEIYQRLLKLEKNSRD